MPRILEYTGYCLVIITVDDLDIAGISSSLIERNDKSVESKTWKMLTLTDLLRTIKSFRYCCTLL